VTRWRAVGGRYSVDCSDAKEDRRLLQRRVAALLAVLLAMPAAGCSDGDGATTTLPTTTTAPDGPPNLLIDYRAEPDPPPLASRSRLVHVDLGILMDGNGKPRTLDEIQVNLFADTTYTAVIDDVGSNGGALTWAGHLEGVDLSDFTMIYTADTFIGHFASPQGIYEVKYVEDGVYRVVQVDQSQMPTEG
jgi:hypothetical protein